MAFACCVWDKLRPKGRIYLCLAALRLFVENDEQGRTLHCQSYYIIPPRYVSSRTLVGWFGTLRKISHEVTCLNFSSFLHSRWYKEHGHKHHSTDNIQAIQRICPCPSLSRTASLFRIEGGTFPILLPFSTVNVCQARETRTRLNHIWFSECLFRYSTGSIQTVPPRLVAKQCSLEGRHRGNFLTVWLVYGSIKKGCHEGRRRQLSGGGCWLPMLVLKSLSRLCFKSRLCPRYV